jgi:hypothetical protein
VSVLEHYRLVQIEQALGRSLSAAELEPVATISSLKPEQIGVVKVLAQQQLVSALDYMRAVVPTALTGELMRFINQYA